VTAVVVGNPKPRSRTLHAAQYVAEALTGTAPDTVIDLAEVGPALLQLGNADVSGLVSEVARHEVVVFASPTYKATYTGLLKLFLDHVPAGALRGVTAVPLMLGAARDHTLAPEVHLRPVLSELGASVPVRALYVLDSAYDDPTAYSSWLEDARPIVRTSSRAATGAAL
jgi:FMN reductase